jgi:hypothetical protein
MDHPGEGSQTGRREESIPGARIPGSMEAKRTIVKSPPELWAEVSDVAALARHLGEFGEIRITRTEPEAVVEWEADRASGTVQLEPSGWGTKVTLTSEPRVSEPVAPEPVAAEPPRPGRFARLMWWRRPVEAPEPPERVEERAVPEPPALDEQRTGAILNGVLDSLGAAHHRPFSR